MTEAPVVMFVVDCTVMSASVQEVVTDPAKLAEAVDEPVAANVRLPQVPEVDTLFATYREALAGKTTSPAASAFCKSVVFSVVAVLSVLAIQMPLSK